MSANQRILLASLACMAMVIGLAHLGMADDSTTPTARVAASATAATTASTPAPSTALPSTAPPSPTTATTPTSTSTPTTSAPTIADPTTTADPATAAAPSDNGCPDSAHGAVIDRNRQRAWLCDNGESTAEFPITTARSQPLPGTYAVYAKDLKASSNFGGHYSTMTHFVAFTRGRHTGARIAFHSIPKLPDGRYIQSFDSVGTASTYGDSSGCIRVLPTQAVEIWDWLGHGDQVVVIN